MKKYNNIKSIDINSLKKSELEIAIKEWAEGSTAMEKLLWSCYNNNIETAGCHVGKKTYLDLYQNNSKKAIIKMLDAAQKIRGSQVLVNPGGDNSRSGDNWEKAYITIIFSTPSRKDSDECLNSLNNSLLKDVQKDISEHFFSQILVLHDYFEGRNNGLLFRFSHTEKDYYNFSIDLFTKSKKYEYYMELFARLGFIFDKENSLDSVKKWMIKEQKLENIVIKTRNIIEKIIRMGD